MTGVVRAGQCSLASNSLNSSEMPIDGEGDRHNAQEQDRECEHLPDLRALSPVPGDQIGRSPIARDPEPIEIILPVAAQRMISEVFVNLRLVFGVQESVERKEESHAAESEDAADDESNWAQILNQKRPHLGWAHGPSASRIDLPSTFDEAANCERFGRAEAAKRNPF